MHRFPAVVSLATALVLGVSTGGSLVVNAQDATPSTDGPAAAGAVIYGTDGQVMGVAILRALPDGGSTIGITALGLEPGEHGVHVHETGACDPEGEKAFTSAGGHYNPSGAEHGEHAGDLGNITIAAEGLASLEVDAEMLTLSELLDADGAAIVIHANPDLNDPEGKSFGARVACGVLTSEAPSA